MRSLAARIARSALVCLAAAGLIACSAEPESRTDSTAIGTSEESVVTTCATSVEAINGKRCSDNLHCTVPITCGSFVQQARCECAGGRFACEDSSGPIAVGSTPRCVQTAPADEQACPATIFETQGQPCETIGKSCFYPGAKCPERPVQHLDSCRCTTDDITGALHFECQIAQCVPADL